MNLSTVPKKEKNGPPCYAALDFDNTCIINDIQDAVLAYLCENNLIKGHDAKRVFTKYYDLLGSGKVQRAYEFAVKALAGYSIKETRAIVRKAIKKEGTKITKRVLFGITINKGLRINRSVKAIIERLRENNCELWVVSASSKHVVAEALKIFFAGYRINCIGIENVLENDILTDRLVYPTSTSEGKVKCIKKHIHKTRRPIVAGGDSMNDLPMLEYAETRFIIDRNNELTQIAGKRKWDILKAE